MPQYLVVMRLGNGDIRRMRLDAANESDATLAARQRYRREHPSRTSQTTIVASTAIRTNEERYGK